MNSGGWLSDLPQYEFDEDPEYAASKAQLGLSESEVDDHVWQMEDTLLRVGPEAEPWSVPLSNAPGRRVTVSSSTEHSPHALRLIFRVEGRIIYRCHIERRNA